MTSRTADFNSAFPARDTNFLFACWTFINMMGLSLAHHIFLSCDPAAKLISLLQIKLVFNGAFINVFGKHAEIGIK